MSNGLRNCALHVCCPPFSVEAKEAFAKDMFKYNPDWGWETCKKVAYWVLDNYDLAPYGTTGDLYAAIAKLALEHEAAG